MSSTQFSLCKRLVWSVHLFSALTRERHTEMLPLLNKHVPKDGVIIDAGDHEGQFAKLFAQAVPQGHVYAFEPRSYARSIISKVISVKKLKNVSLFPTGLSDKTAEETSGSNDAGHAGCPVMREDEDKIVVTTLEQFAFLHRLKRVDFIKADIDGREMRFLLGARPVIEKFRPVIFLEANDPSAQHAGNTAEQVWGFLKSLNYHINRLEDDGVTLTPLSAPVANADIWCVAENRRKGR